MIALCDAANPVKSHRKTRNASAYALVYLLNSYVSGHKQSRDCGHVAARIAQTESKTASVHAPEGGFSEWPLIVIIGL
jgi:hypothetical protein